MDAYVAVCLHVDDATANFASSCTPCSRLTTMPLSTATALKTST